MTNRDAYRLFCREQTALPLFFQDWWLDAVCDKGEWEVCISRDKGGNIQGVMPYYQRRKWGLSVILMPQLTPHLGVWLVYPHNLKQLHRRYSFEKRVSKELLEQLPAYVYFTQSFDPSFTNWLSFYWAGYKQTTAYTYQLNDLGNMEAVYAGLKGSVRTVLRKAEQQMRIVEGTDMEQFYEINRKSFERQGMGMPYSLEFIRRVDSALVERGQREILLAVEESGLVHAGVYLAWDSERMYSLMIGGDTELRNSGAIPLLLWEGVKRAGERGLKFDFEGSMLPKVEPVFASFGATQVPYFRLRKGRTRWIELVWQLLR